MVVLRLRGRTSLGATFLVVAADHARRLEAAGGRLYLSGVDPALLEQIARTGRLDVAGQQLFDTGAITPAEYDRLKGAALN